MAKTMDSLRIKIEKREPMSKSGVKSLRKEGWLPASMSSRGEDSLSFSIKQDELNRSLAQNGRMAVFKLALGRKTYNAMLREVQYAPVTRECLHVTFQRIALDEVTKADVAIRPLGREDITHRQLEFLQHLDTLPVTGLPGDIPNYIELEVSHMEAGDNLTVGDAALPKGITTDLEPDRVIFTVSHPRTQEEPAEEAAETAGVEAAAAEAPEAKE
ncbi:MAG: 50S ribosomal protein L25 [Eubacteriales bacterium]|nr:50S ribosomal protein L25 [Eubacteriales bacterium]